MKNRENIRQKNNRQTGIRRYVVFMVVGVILCVTLIATGCKAIVLETDNGDVHFIHTTSLFISDTKDSPKTVDAYSYEMNTTQNGAFIPTKESGIIVAKPNHTILISAPEQSSEPEITQFIIDCTQGATVFVQGSREYNALLMNGKADVGPCIWENNENAEIKVFKAIPLSGEATLILSTNIAGNAEQEIEDRSAAISVLRNSIQVVDELTVTINGNPINISDIEYLSNSALKMKNGAFLTAEYCDDNAQSNMEKVYGQSIFSDWTSSDKLGKDKEGRVAYVRMHNKIKYALFANDTQRQAAEDVIEFVQQNEGR